MVDAICLAIPVGIAMFSLGWIIGRQAMARKIKELVDDDILAELKATTRDRGAALEAIIKQRQPLIRAQDIMNS